MKCNNSQLKIKNTVKGSEPYIFPLLTLIIFRTYIILADDQ